MTKNYQLICLVSALTKTAERDQIIEKISRLIQDGEGKILMNYPTDERILGYPIKKENNAALLAIDFSCEKEKIQELQKNISTEGLILRSFLKQIPEYNPNVRSKRKSSTLIPIDKEDEKTLEDNITENMSKKEQKVELKDIDKKIEEIFNTKENEFK